MADDPMYHQGMRQLQDLRDTRQLADRLEQVIVRSAFTDEDRAFIERSAMFFIATADAGGRPDCSYKGGLPGFVLPQVNIDGATGTELATPLGTLLTFHAGGISYVVAGSVPPVAAENAARGLR